MYQIASNPLQQQILNIKSEKEEENNPDIKLIKEKLSAQFLLDALEDKYNFGGLYMATKNKDGKERIQVGTRQLNVSDFLTKEVGLFWRDAEPLLMKLYEKQKQHMLGEDMSKNERETMLLEVDEFAKNNGSRIILQIMGQEDNTYYASKRDTVVYKKLSDIEETPILVSHFLDEIGCDKNSLKMLLYKLKYFKEKEKARLSTKHIVKTLR
jgi:hypothetical protein